MRRSAEPAGSYAAFLTRLFRALEERGVRYCVTRNFEELPEAFDGDVDVLLEAGGIARAEAAIEAVCEGCVVLRRVSRNDHRQLWIGSEDAFREALREGRPAPVLMLDLVTRLQWCGVPYLDTDRVLDAVDRHRDMRVSSAAHRASLILCHALLDKGLLKPKYRRELEAVVAAQGRAAFAPLEASAGVACVDRLFAAFASGDDAALLGLRGALARALALRGPAPLARLAGFERRKALRILGALLRPPGILIATAGPDGAGKTTLLERLGVVLGDTFAPVRSCYMGWKEFLLPTKRLLRRLQGGGRGGGAEAAPAARRAPSGMARVGWTHNLSVLHYFADLWARYLVRIRPTLARGGLVVCDRYFYDLLVQPVVLCRNPILRRLLLALTPRPTLTLALSGDAEVIAARKHELTAEETARHMRALAVLRGGPGHLELDALKPVEENAEAVLRALFRGWSRPGA